MLIGYARVSTDDQDLALQRAALKAAGCRRIYEEKLSGATRERPQLTRLLDQMREDDVVVVCRLDRLARSTRDLLDIAELLRAAGAGLRSLGEPWADTGTPAGRMVLTVFAGIAEFERALILSRTSTGRAAAQGRGVRFGRKPKLSGEQIALGQRLVAEGQSAREVARMLRVHVATLYRALGAVAPPLAFGLAWLLAAPAGAVTWQVGPDLELKMPSAAAAVARDGDTVRIAPGTYFDCAVWPAARLTIEGVVEGGGPDVVLTDRACEGKASFVLRGGHVTLRNLTFTRIRVADRNGAGIRVEGGDLTIEHSRFVNNQIGILVGDNPPGVVIVRDCAFSDNGVAERGDGVADLLVGRVALLRVEQSRLRDSRGGAAIGSAALRTELTGNRIGSGPAPSVYLVGAMAGGGLLIDDTVLTLEAGGLPLLGAVAVARDGGLPPGALSLRHTELVNRTGQPAILLRNWSGGTPVLAGNVVQAGDVEMSESGALLHGLKQSARQLIAWLRGLVGEMRQMAVALLHGLR
jgi:DNA invertase Pin-like site-specific DNA recombinase